MCSTAIKEHCTLKEIVSGRLLNLPVMFKLADEESRPIDVDENNKFSFESRISIPDDERSNIVVTSSPTNYDFLNQTFSFQ